MTDKLLMQRRIAIKYLPVAFAISASAEQLADLALKVKAEDFKAGSETPDLITALADLILPATSTPSASQAGVTAFIDLFMKEIASTSEREAFYALMNAFANDCQEQYGLSFETLPPSAQQVHFGGLLQVGDEFCVQFKRLTLIGYFTSQTGMTEALTYLPIPGSYTACLQATPETKSEASYF